MELLWVLLLLVNLGLVAFLVFRKPAVSVDQNRVQEKLREELTQNREELQRNLRESRLELTKSLDRLVDTIAKKAKEDREEQRTTLKDFQEAFSKNVKEFNELQKQKFEAMRLKQDELVKTTELRLEKMRETVDEKLHKTLEERLGKSFEIVTQQLLRVQKGLGEMQTLAAGVGDLKKVLSNVKTRGVLGEIQLANILEQILAPEQYEANVKTKKGSDALV
ncbi:MAG TPA: DNA recombination protein RmuC, partial [Flavobacteriaceae bacterium]|nr:DNA recombination protein RmuC [Flavobacteriaceae bacterium]